MIIPLSVQLPLLRFGLGRLGRLDSAGQPPPALNCSLPARSPGLVLIDKALG